jgi:hypothetical protein
MLTRASKNDDFEKNHYFFKKIVAYSDSFATVAHPWEIMKWSLDGASAAQRALLAGG